MKRTTVVVNLKVPGIHHWSKIPNTPELSAVQYLAFPHRHMFHIKCKKEVTDLNRQIEILIFKQNIIDYLYTRYHNESSNCLYFGEMSCEMIAEELVKYFGLYYCEVLEDGENGADVYYEPKQTEVVEDDKKHIDTIAEEIKKYRSIYNPFITNIA